VPFRLRPLTAEIRAFRAFWPIKCSNGALSGNSHHFRSPDTWIQRKMLVWFHLDAAIQQHELEIRV
jgi:hypothetical protein